MTCVVGMIDTENRTQYLASDSLYSDGSRAAVGRVEKVFRVGPYLIGFCGNPRAIQLLRYNTKLPLPPKDPASLMGFMASKFIGHVRKLFNASGLVLKGDGVVEQLGDMQIMVVVGGHIFVIWTDMQVEETAEDYNVIGSGEDLALGSLYSTEGHPAETRIRMAIVAASHHCASVGGPVNLLELPY